MRSFLIIGGFIGFLLGLGFGLANESSWPTILWRSSVGAVVGGMVLRWWGGIWVRSVVEAHQQRQEARVNQASAPAPERVAHQAQE